jgi:hypothetical protein
VVNAMDHISFSIRNDVQMTNGDSRFLVSPFFFISFTPGISFDIGQDSLIKIADFISSNHHFKARSYFGSVVGIALER